MNAKILIAGAAIVALTAGGASAATHHKKMHKMHKSDDMAASSKYAAPDQPIPYAQMDSYMSSHGMTGDDMGATKSSGTKKMSKSKMHHGKMHHHMKGSASGKAMSSPDNGAMANPPATPPADNTPSTPQ